MYLHIDIHSVNVHVRVCTLLALMVVCYGVFVRQLCIQYMYYSSYRAAWIQLECIWPPDANPFVMGELGDLSESLITCLAVIFSFV